MFLILKKNSYQYENKNRQQTLHLWNTVKNPDTQAKKDRQPDETDIIIRPFEARGERECFWPNGDCHFVERPVMPLTSEALAEVIERHARYLDWVAAILANLKEPLE